MAESSDLTLMQQIVIVRRDKFATFGQLAQAFASEPNVRLVWDRRLRDRRRHSPSGDPTDRRRRDRRQSPSTIWGPNDYLLLNIAGSVAPDTARAGGIGLADAATSERTCDREEVRRDFETAVRSDLSVLISGGDVMSRRSMADRIHARSDRRDRPLIVVNPDAFFDESVPGSESRHAARLAWINAGTMLIEELADLTWEQQSQLWLMLERTAVQASDPRTPQTRDARIISGTKHWMLERVASKQFRADLFYRLNVIHLVLPADSVRTLE